MFIKYFYILLIAIVVVPLQAQDISFVANAPETVQVGEQFQIVYVINDRVKDFTPPSFTDFVYLSGQKGINTINWKTTQQFVYIFKATHVGEFTIEPAEAKHKGDVIVSNKLTIKVVSGAKQTQSPQSSSSTNSNSPAASTSGGRDVFVSLILDKRNSYVGEQITGYIKVYTKKQLSGIDNNFKGPDFTGFYVQNLKIPQLRSLESEKVGGETYYSGLIRKVILIPQKSGDIKISPFNLDVQYDKKVRIGHYTTYQPQNVSLTSKEVNVKVNPLPSNKPAGFTGAIGEFSIKATMSADNVKTNDAVIFNVIISGKGNIKLIDKISYSLPPAIDDFDPIIKTKLSESGHSGSKTFEITAIPRHAGEYVIKPFEIVFFNPKTKSFDKRQTNSFILKVSKGEGDSTSVVYSNLSREDVELLQSDIRYIKTETKLLGAKRYIVDSYLYYTLILTSFVFFILILVLRRKQIKRSADIVRTKNRKANKIANKRFKMARKLLADNNQEAFYEELSKAIWGYISDKLNIPQSELSAQQAAERLKANKVDAVMVDELLGIIEICEFTRYAPGNADKLPADLLKEANKLLTRIEQNI